MVLRRLPQRQRLLRTRERRGGRCALEELYGSWVPCIELRGHARVLWSDPFRHPRRPTVGMAVLSSRVLRSDFIRLSFLLALQLNGERSCAYLFPCESSLFGMRGDRNISLLRFDVLPYEGD